jgi:presenilin-like A22 family membrane protease
MVIFGFFVVALRDETVRREIFAGQAGIQFITLFSLVIAIILFGITDILEGKELSALLGGLSGYILGRSTATRQSSASGGQTATDPPLGSK